MRQITLVCCLALAACKGLGGFASGFGHLASGVGHVASGVASGAGHVAVGLGHVATPVLEGAARATPMVVRVAADVATQTAIEVLDETLDFMTWGAIIRADVETEDEGYAPQPVPRCEDAMRALAMGAAGPPPDYCW